MDNFYTCYNFLEHFHAITHTLILQIRWNMGFVNTLSSVLISSLTWDANLGSSAVVWPCFILVCISPSRPSTDSTSGREQSKEKKRRNRCASILLEQFIFNHSILLSLLTVPGSVNFYTWHCKLLHLANELVKKVIIIIY